MASPTAAAHGRPGLSLCCRLGDRDEGGRPVWGVADGGWGEADGGWGEADGGWGEADGGWGEADRGWGEADGGWGVGGARNGDPRPRGSIGRANPSRVGWAGGGLRHRSA